MTNTNAQMGAEVEAKVTTNGLRENTGLRVRTALLAMLAREGQPNGIAPLDADGIVPVEHLPVFLPADPLEPTVGSNEPSSENLQAIAFQYNDDNLHQGQHYNFSTDFWQKGNCTVVENVAIAPDGTQSAHKIVESLQVGADFHFINQQTRLAVIDVSRRFLTTRLKAGERTWAWFRDADSTNSGAYFNLASGVVGTQGANNVAAQMVYLGSGWWLCEIEFITTSAFSRPQVILVTGDGATTYVGDGVSGLYIWNKPEPSTILAKLSEYPNRPYISMRDAIGSKPVELKLFAVAEYGGDLEAIEDDTEALEELIDFLNGSSSGGTIILGAHNFSSKIDLATFGGQFWGTGFGSSGVAYPRVGTLLRWNANTPTEVMFECSAAHGLAFRGAMRFCVASGMALGTFVRSIGAGSIGLRMDDMWAGQKGVGDDGTYKKFLEFTGTTDGDTGFLRYLRAQDPQEYAVDILNKNASQFHIKMLHCTGAVLGGLRTRTRTYLDYMSCQRNAIDVIVGDTEADQAASIHAGFITSEGSGRLAELRAVVSTLTARDGLSFQCNDTNNNVTINADGYIINMIANVTEARIHTPAFRITRTADLGAIIPKVQLAGSSDLRAYQAHIHGIEGIPLSRFITPDLVDVADKRSIDLQLKHAGSRFPAFGIRHLGQFNDANLKTKRSGVRHFEGEVDFLGASTRFVKLPTPTIQMSSKIGSGATTWKYKITYEAFDGTETEASSEATIASQASSLSDGVAENTIKPNWIFGVAAVRFYSDEGLGGSYFFKKRLTYDATIEDRHDTGLTAPQWVDDGSESVTGVTAPTINSTGGITIEGPSKVGVYTVAALPPVAVAGALVYVSNETGGAVPAFGDGTNWRRMTDRAVVS